MELQGGSVIMVSLRRITAKVMANLVKISATVMTGSGRIAVTEGGGAPARAAAQGPLALRGVKMADRGSFATVWFGMEEVGALVISSL